MRSTSFAVVWLFLICAATAGADEFRVRQIVIELQDDCTDAPPTIYLVFNDDETHRVTATRRPGTGSTWTWPDSEQKPLTFSDPKDVHASVQFAGNRTFCRKPDNYKNEMLRFSFKCSSVPLPNLLISSKPSLTLVYDRIVGKDQTDARPPACIEKATFFSANPRKLLGYWENNEHVLLYLLNRMSPALPLDELIHDKDGRIRATTIGRPEMQKMWMELSSAKSN